MFSFDFLVDCPKEEKKATNRIMDHEINNDTSFFVSSSKSSYSASSILLVLPRAPFCYTLDGQITFLTRELRVCARASCRYDVENGTRSLDWSIPVNLFSILGF